MRLVLVLVGFCESRMDGALRMLKAEDPFWRSIGTGIVVGIDLGPDDESALRASAKRRGVTLRTEICQRLKLSLADVSSDALSHRVNGDDD